MLRSRMIALIWLFAGLAFVCAGVLGDRRQPAFFAVGTVCFAVTVIQLRRSRHYR